MSDVLMVGYDIAFGRENSIHMGLYDNGERRYVIISSRGLSIDLKDNNLTRF